MSMLRRAGAWLGGVMLFFGILSIITLFSLNSSGVMTPQYFNYSIHQIISTSSNISGGSLNNQYLNSTEISTILSTIGQNPNCNILCLISSQLGTKSNITPFLTSSSLNLYQLILEMVAVLGVVLIFFSYTNRRAKLTAFGRIPLSAAIISFVSTYIPIMFIIPYLFSGITISNITLNIPVSVVSPFTSKILVADIFFGVLGVAILVVNSILNGRVKKQKEVPLPPTQLEIKKE